MESKREYKRIYMRKYRADKKRKEAKNNAPTIKTTKTRAEYQKEYRQRKKASAAASAADVPTTSTKKTPAQCQAEYRARLKRKKLEKLDNTDVPTTSTNSTKKTQAQYQAEYRARQKRKNLQKLSNNEKTTKRPKTNYVTANVEFETRFTKNTLGHICNVCDRLWFDKDLSGVVAVKGLELLQNEFQGENVNEFKICGTCKGTLNTGKSINKELETVPLAQVSSLNPPTDLTDLAASTSTARPLSMEIDKQIEEEPCENLGIHQSALRDCKFDAFDNSFETSHVQLSSDGVTLNPQTKVVATSISIEIDKQIKEEPNENLRIESALAESEFDAFGRTVVDLIRNIKCPETQKQCMNSIISYIISLNKDDN